jgi:hypothetical protein
MPTPPLSPGAEAGAPGFDGGEFTGIGGGPITCDTRREMDGEDELDGGAAD